MPDSTETLVYINAPTLDNTDECTFVKNNDFLYATAGDTNRGDTANLVLYDKLVDPGCHSLLDSPDISRNTFNTGEWGLPVNNVDKPWNGGDYFINGAAQVKADLFRTGHLKQVRFKFFTKESYNTEFPNLMIPNVGAHLDTELTEEELWALLNDKSANNGIVTKIALLIPNIVNGKQSGWKFGAFGKLNLADLPLSDRDWFLYDIEGNFSITANMMEKQNYTFAFFFFPNSDNWRSSNNKTIEEVFTPSRTFSPQNLRDIIGNGDSDRTVAMRSVPRGSLDGSSYIYAPTTGTGDGTRNGQNRLIELEYCIETDLVNEYLGDNAEKHHLDIKEVQELNTLRYNAPLSPDKSWTEKKATVTKVYISHNSLSRNGAIDVIGKEIKSIRIPFKLGSESDYLVSGMLQNNMTNRQGGMCHTNRKIHISLDNGTTFIESSNYFAYSYFDEHMIYEWFFESENINDLKYSGNGIVVKAAPPSGEVGFENFAINLFTKDEKYYAYSSEDLVDTTNGGYRNINATADIKVIFNYIQRGEWFDYIETKENDTLIEVKNINDYINEHSYIINSFYTTQHTYTRYINDRIGFKWVELCPAHSLTLKGELKRVDVVTSSNQWTPYTDPVYLCIYEKNDENVFVKKAVSTNSLIPQRASIHSWSFDNVLFEGKPIRVGYILEPEDVLAELGETQPNPSMQTNAVTGEAGYDGECYVCNDSGVRQNFGCPMSFTFTNIVNIKNDISNLQENTTTINQNIADINQSITNINQTINNISQSGILNLGKWRIYINDNGDLVIDTEALASAGKSITFKDIEI